MKHSSDPHKSTEYPLKSIKKDGGYPNPNKQEIVLKTGSEDEKRLSRVKRMHEWYIELKKVLNR